MSKIGRRPIILPAGVKIEVTNEKIVVSGPKGQLEEQMQPGVSITVQDQTVEVSRANDERQTRAFHGLVRSLINNMVIGVSEGFVRELEMVGTGYRAAMQGSKLVLSVGYSHQVEVQQQPGVTIQVEGNTKIKVSGISKHDVGQLAANIRAVRPPEPYKGKGIKYVEEVVRRKAGKAAGKGA